MKLSLDFEEERKQEPEESLPSYRGVTPTTQLIMDDMLEDYNNQSN